MKLLSFCLLFFLCVSINLSSQSYESAVDSFLSKKMEEFRIPVISVAIVDNGIIAMQQSLGNFVIN